MGFQKGKSGNPGGRPKEKHFHTALMLELKEAGEEMPKLRKVAKALLDEAENGNLAAIRELADRLDGRPHQTIDTTIDDRRDIDDWSDAELLALLATRDRRKGAGKETGETKPSSVH